MHDGSSPVKTDSPLVSGDDPAASARATNADVALHVAATPNADVALHVAATPNADVALHVAALKSDPMAIFRAAESLSRTGEVPPAAFSLAVKNQLDLLATLTIAQHTAGIESCLCHREVHLALQWLHEVGVVARLLPELEATVDFTQEAGRRHKDVWEHTKIVVRQSVPRPAVRWGALLHDIGKVPTRGVTPDGKVHFHGHAEVGARMFRRLAKRFAFSPAMHENIHFLILHHLRASQYEPSWTESAVRRFGKELDAHLVDLLDLSRADITSKRPGRRSSLLEQIHELQTRIDDVKKADAKRPPLRKGIGVTITERFGIPPSKRIGELKQLLEQKIEDGTLEAYREDEYYLDWLVTAGHVEQPC